VDCRFSFIIPFHSDLASLARCLGALQRLPPASEVIIAADGARDDCRPLASVHGARVIAVDGPAGLPRAKSRGPAVARNAGAAQATGDVLVFVDADVVVSQDGLTRMAHTFREQPATAAVFGAYDEEPADPGFMSQYKNLAHSFIHRSSATTARTFWAGFGAVRREAFHAVGGFDERFARPSVEDIDFGYRLTNAGFTVVLDPALSACHLKRWTVHSAIASDVFDRGIPWTQLILKYGARADHLNVRAEHRWSVVAAYMALLAMVLGSYDSRFLPSAAVSLAVLTGLNRDYYFFFYRRRGVAFAARAWLLHLLTHWYNGLSFATGIVLYGSARYLRLRLPGCLPTDSWPGCAWKA
jgi:GT2 family glycosyltransferase